MKTIRRKSLRFQEEQAEIEIWLTAMEKSLKRSIDFAMALAELPRVLKGYSDTLLRGKIAYKKIWEGIVKQAIDTGLEAQDAPKLRAAIGAALADENHEKLDHLLTGSPETPPILTRPQTPMLAHGGANA